MSLVVSASVKQAQPNYVHLQQSTKQHIFLWRTIYYSSCFLVVVTVQNVTLLPSIGIKEKSPPKKQQLEFPSLHLQLSHFFWFSFSLHHNHSLEIYSMRQNDICTNLTVTKYPIIPALHRKESAALLGMTWCKNALLVKSSKSKWSITNSFILFIICKTSSFYRTHLHHLNIYTLDNYQGGDIIW